MYGERRRALMAQDLSPQLVEYAERTVDDILEVMSLVLVSYTLAYDDDQCNVQLHIAGYAGDSHDLQAKHYIRCSGQSPTLSTDTGSGNIISHV